MPELFYKVATPWQSGATLHGSVVATPWQAGATLHSLGGPYTAPAAPPGGTPGTPSTSPRYTIAARPSYRAVHTLSVTDMRDDAELPVESLSISNDEDAVYWSLTMGGGAALYAKLTTGDQPATVRVVLDGQTWRFAVQSASRSRAHPGATVQVTGYSLTSIAGAPYELERVWSIDGDTSAAQIAAAANVQTGVQIVWALSDWSIPDRVFSHNGTPLTVVKRVAESVGAMVQSGRADTTLFILPRYPLLPNEWEFVAPDVEIALDALDSESFDRSDRPPYDGVYVTGQQQGVVAFVRLAGTNGGNLHPLVTDVLITDIEAARQRGMAELGKSGEQQRHTISLPVLTGVGEPGVLDVGMLVRVVEPGLTWHGLVRSVRVDVTLPTARQTVVLERHTKAIPGTVDGTALPPSLVFVGPIADQSFGPQAAVSFDLTPFWSNGVPPVLWSMRSGTLPAWLTLDASAGALNGTTPGEVSLRLEFEGTGATATAVDTSPFAESRTLQAGTQISTSKAKVGSSSLKVTHRNPLGMFWSGSQFGRAANQKLTIRTYVNPVAQQNATAAPTIFRLFGAADGQPRIWVSKYGAGNDIAIRVALGTQAFYSVPGDAEGWVWVVVDIDDIGDVRMYLNGTIVHTEALGNGSWDFGGLRVAGEDSATSTAPIELYIDQFEFIRDVNTYGSVGGGSLIQIRATDAIGSTADSNPFEVGV